MRAAIYVYLGGAPVDKQQRLAVEHCTKCGYLVTSLVFHPQDAFNLVRQGVIDVVVTAYAAEDEPRLAELVEAAGGKLERARCARRGLSWDVIRMISRMSDRGMSVAEISEVVGEATGEIRLALRRLLQRGL